MYICGIDVGVNGGIVVINSSNLKIVESHRVPKAADRVDLNKYAEIILAIRKKYTKVGVRVFIENVHALYLASAGTTFAFGKMAMLPEAVCSSYRMPYELVSPKTWQKIAWSGVKPVMKIKKIRKKVKGKKGEYTTETKESVDTKKTSLLAFKRIFPDVKETHDGVVDAALIAYFGHIKFFGGVNV